MCIISKQSPLGEGRAAVVAHDQVVEHADVDEGERVLQAMRYELVGLAGLGHA